MVNPIQANTQTTIIPIDSFRGQKQEQGQESPRPVIDRKNEVPTAREEVPREEVEKTTEKLNRLMGIINKQLKFDVSEKNQRVSVKIIDQETGKVLDEIPPKRILEMLDSFTKFVGLLIDKKV